MNHDLWYRSRNILFWLVFCLLAFFEFYFQFWFNVVSQIFHKAIRMRSRERRTKLDFSYFADGMFSRNFTLTKLHNRVQYETPNTISWSYHSCRISNFKEVRGKFVVIIESHRLKKYHQIDKTNSNRKITEKRSTNDKNCAIGQHAITYTCVLL